MSHVQLCIVKNANETVAVEDDTVRGDLYKDEHTRKTLTLALLLRYLIHKRVS